MSLAGILPNLNGNILRHYLSRGDIPLLVPSGSSKFVLQVENYTANTPLRLGTYSPPDIRIEKCNQKQHESQAVTKQNHLQYLPRHQTRNLRSYIQPPFLTRSRYHTIRALPNLTTPDTIQNTTTSSPGQRAIHPAVLSSSAKIPSRDTSRSIKPQPSLRKSGTSTATRKTPLQSPDDNSKWGFL